MARKSRKNAALTEIPTIVQRVYNVGVYVRLSIEECRDRKDSDSLENQKNIIYDYISKDPALKIFTVYADNGETGTNFDRPEFQRMMYDISKGFVDCVIVKDLSRFGREYVETSDYIDRFFPLIGVRFIAINDNYDSNVLKSSDGVVIPFKNIINTIYAKDISKKSSTALRIKQAKGEFIGAYAPYGYLKDPNDRHTLIIDEETAPIVRDVFKWKSEGLSTVSIARRLTEMNIDPPCKYRYKKGILKDKKFANQSFWQTVTIKTIIGNPVYLGHITQGRRKSRFYEGKQEERVAPENWIIVKNTHLPIITKDIFDKAHEIMNERKEQYNSNLGKYNNLRKSENMFKGKVVCGECGTRLVRDRNIKNDKVNYLFVCPTHANVLDKCSFLQMRENDLINITLSLIKNQIFHAIELEKVLANVKKRPEIRERIIRIDKDIRDATANISYIKDGRKQLFSDFTDKIVSQDEYKYAKEQYDIDYRMENERLLYLQKQQEVLKSSFTENKWIKELKKYKSVKMLSKEIIDTFISKIKIYSNKTVEIEWNFGDFYEQRLRALKAGDASGQ